MQHSNRMRAGLALVACVAVGAAGGIAGSAAAPSKSKSTSAGTYPTDKPGGHRGPPRGGPGPGGRAVHSEEVVLNKAGTAFITETDDNGKVKSVSGQDVTITEGTDKVAYKDVTVTLPAGAKIDRNGKTAAIGDLKAGDHIRVSQSSDGTVVFAADDSFKPTPPKGPGHRRGGPGPRPGPAGPPPGGMPAP